MEVLPSPLKNNSNNSNVCFLAGSEGEEAQGSTSSPAEPQISGSETDFSDFEGGGEKESGLMARVRQCSLQAINAVIDVSLQHSGLTGVKLEGCMMMNDRGTQIHLPIYSILGLS